MVPGEITCENLNMVARSYIEEWGYGKGLWHQLGHSMGRGIHECPYLMPGYKQVLQKTTFTTEPSVIIDDKLLIRVEDVVALCNSSGLLLNNHSRDIIVI
jgi:Xaa-Pro aminopeptidase